MSDLIELGAHLGAREASERVLQLRTRLETLMDEHLGPLDGFTMLAGLRQLSPRIWMGLPAKRKPFTSLSARSAPPRSIGTAHGPVSCH